MCFNPTTIAVLMRRKVGSVNHCSGVEWVSAEPLHIAPDTIRYFVKGEQDNQQNYDLVDLTERSGNSGRCAYYF